MQKKIIATILQNDGFPGVVKYIEEEKRQIHKSYFLTICLFVIIVAGLFIQQEERHSREIEKIKRETD